MKILESKRKGGRKRRGRGQSAQMQSSSLAQRMGTLIEVSGPLLPIRLNT